MDYHTDMGDVLVGVLIAIGIFLIAYKGHPRQTGERLSDHLVAIIAGIGVIGVALLPAEPPALEDCSVQNEILTAAMSVRGITLHWCRFEWIHFVSATVFFLCMAVFCFVLFPRGDRTMCGRISWKSAENRLYFICGTLLLLSIVALLAYAVLGSDSKIALRERNYVFW